MLDRCLWSCNLLLDVYHKSIVMVHRFYITKIVLQSRKCYGTLFLSQKCCYGTLLLQGCCYGHRSVMVYCFYRKSVVMVHCYRKDVVMVTEVLWYIVFIVKVLLWPQVCYSTLFSISRKEKCCYDSAFMRKPLE